MTETSSTSKAMNTLSKLNESQPRKKSKRWTWRIWKLPREIISISCSKKFVNNQISSEEFLSEELISKGIFSMLKPSMAWRTSTSKK